MYLEFFGLKEPPFSITPDPRFVFLSERHRDALAHLLYGVGKGGSGGFVQLTGEVGTGKTTLSRLLLEQLPDNTRVALVLNPKLSAIELLESICEELKLEVGDARGSLKGLVDRLNTFLLDAYAAGQRIVVVIDEAQNLSIDALEQVRLLTNLETPTQKLLQIILLGQPELRELLDKPELRQLAQRITARYHLTPLDEDETEAFVRHRLAVAGSPRFPFTRLGVRELHRRSGGVPRLINIIAERALMAGYVADEPQIGERLVDHAADEVTGKRRRRRNRHLVTAAIVALLGVTALWAARQAPRSVAPEPAADVPAAAGLTHEALAERVASLPEDAWLGAWTALLAQWQVDPSRLTVPDAARCPLHIYPGLSCLRLSGNIAKLRALDRPVLLQLHVGDRHPVALLRAIGMRSARLDFGVPTRRDDPGSAVVVVPLTVLEGIWLGEFHAVWKSPEALPDTIKRGDTGPAAEWLREPLEAGAPAEVDADLEARVREVQARFGLSPDGIVGPETELALTSRDPGGPVLGRELP
jgi:general secretion pathway protein A